MGGAISASPNPSPIDMAGTCNIDLDSYADSLKTDQTDAIDIEAMTQQSELFRTCIADVTNKICRELVNLRADNKKLRNDLEKERKKNKKGARKFANLQAKHIKLQDDLEFQKNLVHDKGDKILQLEHRVDMSTLAGLQRNGSFNATMLADHLIKRSRNQVSTTDLPPVLRGFTPLKKIGEVASIVESAELKNAEEIFLKDPKSGVSIKALKEHVHVVKKTLKAAIAKRLRTHNILEECRLE